MGHDLLALVQVHFSAAITAGSCTNDEAVISSSNTSLEHHLVAHIRIAEIDEIAYSVEPP